jgi:excisionase family DNA binding protein
VSDRLLDALEVAELLAVPVGWVREHTRSGAVPHVQLGRYVRYDRGEVLAWVESLKSGGGPSFRRYQPTTSLRAAEGGAR